MHPSLFNNHQPKDNVILFLTPVQRPQAQILVMLKQSQLLDNFSVTLKDKSLTLSLSGHYHNTILTLLEIILESN